MSSGTKGHSLHIVGLPLHFIFGNLNGYEIVRKLPIIHYFYLFSAHVEPSRDVSFLIAIKHFFAHFSIVANYREGKERGCKLLSFKPSDSKLIEDLGFLLPKSRNHSPLGKDQKPRNLELDNEKKWLKNIFKTFKRHRHTLGVIAAIAFLIFFLIMVAVTLSVKDPIEAIKAQTTDLGPTNYEIALALVSVILLFPCAFFVKNAFKMWEEKEKTVISTFIIPICFAIIGICFIYSIFFSSNQLLNWVFLFAMYIIVVGFLYNIAIENPLIRFLVVLSIILTIEIVFVSWLTEFLVQTGISNHIILFELTALVTALLITLLIGSFYNYLKGVEIILEMEDSFGLYVGTPGVGRSVMKNMIQEKLGIPEKLQLYERILGWIGTIFGFRPQGVIEFHINLDKGNLESKELGIIGGEVGFYPVKKAVYDGTSLDLDIMTSSYLAKLKFKEFMVE